VLSFSLVFVAIAVYCYISLDINLIQYHSISRYLDILEEQCMSDSALKRDDFIPVVVFKV